MSKLDIAPAVFIPLEARGTWEDVREETLEKLKFFSQQCIPHLPEIPPHDGKAAIIGASPQVADFVEEFKNHEVMKFSINGAHDFLIKNGIIPNAQVLFEPDIEDPRISLGGEPHKEVIYYICSHCHQNLFHGLDGYKRVLWHCFNGPEDYKSTFSELFPDEFMVGGGHVTFFRTINIAIILGFRHLDIYGCDSSFRGANSHVGDYLTKPTEPEIDVWVGSHETSFKKFHTLGTLAFQAHEFMKFCQANQEGLRIRIHGDGLLGALHKLNFPEQYEGTH